MLILTEIGYALDTHDEQLIAYTLDQKNYPILSEPILISSLSNSQIISKFGAFTMSLVPQSNHICHVCGVSYPTKSGRSNTCSDSCRTQKSRIKKDLCTIGVDDLFMNEFRLHVKNLDADNFTFSSSYLLENMRGFEEIVKKLSPKTLKYLILSNQ
ncbi:hypothetical protein [Sulfurospirillum multivorans]|uniref:Uncharacterized protein n=2 Tax=Sulfurospirillum multivorans TaxID=66821 RepID=A0AA86DYE0_SULMK|nr:hypothetical protein [Sulfurospirillum multivorans]AHJ13098.1 hypothetical protein SMUL_1843 [Sulfurospirillum multivorans DSM 12446]QEH06586.1 hypothetical protein SMN_1821 [Sulfurospirillum multivorans]